MSFFREQVVKRFTRSRGWSKVRKEHLKRHPFCAVCGGNKKLEVHHIRDFSTYPEIELDPANLITLCRKRDCHYLFGHLLNWKSINPVVEVDASLMNRKIVNRR